MSDAKCPVCGWDLPKDAPSVVVAGRQVTVCCDECAQKARQQA
jgi:hypothetical protein